MAERSSWAVMDGATRVVDAEDSRLAVGALWTPGASGIRARQGIRPGAGDPGKVTVSGTPDKNVLVNRFQAVVTASRGVGEYIATLDADKTLDLLTADPMGAQPRWDLIIAAQTDTFYGDGSSAFEVQQVVGTPAGSPSDPSLAAFDDYIILERIKFPALATTVQDSYLDHLSLALPRSVGLGGLLPVYTVTERDALAAYDGMQCYRMDKDWTETYDGTAWRVPDGTVVGALADITNPRTNQLAFLSTDRSFYRWSGSWSRLITGVRVFEAVQSAATQAMATGSAVDIAGATSTFTTLGTNSVVSVTATVDGESNGITDIGLVTCVVGASTLAGELHWGPAGRASYSKSWKATVAAAGSVTVKLQGKKSGGTNTFTTYQTHTNLVVTVYDA